MTHFQETLHHYFTDLSAKLFHELKESESLSLYLCAEDSTFVRFTQGKIRQSTKVKQASVYLSYGIEGKEVRLLVPLCFDEKENHKMARHSLDKLRSIITGFPSDPYLNVLQKHPSTEIDRAKATTYLLDDVFSKLEPYDAVGLWCSGPVVRGYINSVGTKHWFTTDQFFLDYSFYTPDQKAVKKLLAGDILNTSLLEKQIEDAKEELVLLKGHSKTLAPDAYRAYFSPHAVNAFLELLSWGGLGYASYKKGHSPLKDLAEEKKSLSSKFSLYQDFSHGLMPSFNLQGACCPEKLNLVESGHLKNWLISERTAKEYQVESNAASDSEGLMTATVTPGHLEEEKILSTLGTGIYVDHLHYLNWSDIQAGRITGMTRYACFWVENGKKVAPIKDMRFDETLYHFFGDGLVDLTSFQRMIVDTGTYDQRSLGGNCVPGMIVDGFHFTL